MLVMGRRQDYSDKKFKENFKRFKKTLESNKELSKSQKDWLIQQRHLYKNRSIVGYDISEERIQMLDSLNPLLDKDWNVSRTIIPVEQRLYNLYEDLKAGASISEEEEKWLLYTSNRLRNSSDPKEVTTKRLLNKLNTLLDFEWLEKKLSKLELIFESHYKSIKSKVENEELLSDKELKWIQSQQHRYTAQHHIKISSFEFERIKELKQLLQLDWEIAPVKEISSETENPKLRKQIEKWVMQISPFLNFSKIERHYGMPKGKLQKFIKYNASLEYKWILALEDFKDFLKKGHFKI